MKRWSNIVWALLATLALASSAFAQGGGASSTGSISGEVKDAQGGVLPGVTVTATSPAQIGSLTAVTNEAGLYRFPAVPPGEYRLAYELAGFQGNVRDGIRITLGFNAQVNVTLNVATLQETVTVSGESPVIDTTLHARPDQLRPADAVVDSERARHVVAAGDDAVGVAQPRRRRRLDGRHADHLLRLRLLGPEPAADRGHQHHRGHRRRPASISTTARSRRCSSAPPATRPRCRTPAC